MTAIDQVLTGAAPVKQGNNGGKITEKNGDEKGSNNRDAFENAFADAGRKKADAGKQAEEQGKKELANKKPLYDLRLPVQVEGRNKPAASETDALPERNATDESTEEPSTRKKLPVRTDLAGLRQFDLKSLNKPMDKDDTAAIEIDAEATPEVDMSTLMELLTAAQAPPTGLESAGERPVDAKLAASVGVVQEAPVRTAKTEPKKDTGSLPGKAAETKASIDLPLADMPETETDTIFRFAREDGKGRPVDLRTNGPEGAGTDADQRANAKIETVTVVEARRYLGLPANSNASALTAAMSGNDGWVSSMRPGSALLDGGAESSTGKVVNTLKLQMHPVDLGTVTATLRLTGDQLNVDLRVETGEAYRQLSDDQKGILKALRAQGFAVDQINVVFVQTDPSVGAGQSADGASQQQFSQSARDGSGTGTQQGRGQQDETRQAAALDGKAPRDESVDETAPAVGTDRGRPEHVYL